MKRIELGRSGIEVMNYCLGTMTYGTQTAEADAHAQLDLATEAGLDFMDTAEMYPVNPLKAETAGRTEEIIGNWVAKSGKRDKWVIATKHTGARSALREGRAISAETIRETLEGSLRRLQTDYVDVYQFHWPNRAHYHFRRNWDFTPEHGPDDETRDTMAAMLEVMQALVAEGKVRAFGLSNETAWGAMRWLETAEKIGGPRPATVQNEYSLLCRHYDTDMGEIGFREDLALLAFSPLAAGLLTGKYRNGALPEGSRKTHGETLGGRVTARTDQAVDAYLAIAKAHAIDPVHLALAWTVSRPFPTIPIFGATTNDQLDRVIHGLDVTLGAEVLDAISKAHRAHPLPF